MVGFQRWLNLLHRVVGYWWKDPRTERVCELVREQPDQPLRALKREDYNRMIAYVLIVGHPPRFWGARDWEAVDDPHRAQAVRDNIAAGYVKPPGAA